MSEQTNGEATGSNGDRDLLNGESDPLKGERNRRTGRFQPGNKAAVGRRPASAIVPTAPHLGAQILLAAERAGFAQDPKADDGVTAYLEWLASSQPKSFSSLISKMVAPLPVRVAIPTIEKPADLVAATSAVVAAVAEGELSTSDASAVSNVIGSVAKAIELHEISERLAKLEAAVAKEVPQ
jgi:hypothetical protein